VLHDLCDPFIGVEVLHYQYHAFEREEGFEISAILEQRDLKITTAAPRMLRAALAGRTGVFEITGETCGGRKFQIHQEKEKEFATSG
jgi:hypothetical protein